MLPMKRSWAHWRCKTRGSAFARDREWGAVTVRHGQGASWAVASSRADDSLHWCGDQHRRWPGIRLRRSPDSPVTVMTRNIYLGGNINRPIRAALDRTGREGVLALGHANHELREVVTRTDFTTRSKLLADEIAATRPDLIGLQEVALWRHGPMQLDQVGRPNATQVDYDFLAILLADLANRGVAYEIVHVQ